MTSNASLAYLYCSFLFLICLHWHLSYLDVQLPGPIIDLDLKSADFEAWEFHSFGNSLSIKLQHQKDEQFKRFSRLVPGDPYPSLVACIIFSIASLTCLIASLCVSASKLNFCFGIFTAHPPSRSAIRQDGYLDDLSWMLNVVPRTGCGLKGARWQQLT